MFLRLNSLLQKKKKEEEEEEEEEKKKKKKKPERTVRDCSGLALIKI